MEQKVCEKCHFPIADNFYFCPNCGKKIKDLPLSTSVSKQIYIYALSIILPPLGLWPGIKYIRQKDPKAKRIGIIAIVLTIVATVVTVWITMGIMNNILGQASSNQMQQLQNLGY